jgi:hypothetical protein
LWATERIIVVELPASPQLKLREPAIHVYAVIRSVKLLLPNTGIPRHEQLRAIEVVDIDNVQCLVGRIRDRGAWSIVDRGSSFAQHQLEDLERLPNHDDTEDDDEDA